MGRTLKYKLPERTDSDGDVITLTVGKLPSFVTFNDPEFEFAPVTDEDRGTKSINIVLNDGKTTTTYTLKVTVFTVPFAQ